MRLESSLRLGTLAAHARRPFEEYRTLESLDTFNMDSLRAEVDEQLKLSYSHITPVQAKEFLNAVESFPTTCLRSRNPRREHDQQMNACLDAGGGRGVLCADGHKGYSSPSAGDRVSGQDLRLGGRFRYCLRKHGVQDGREAGRRAAAHEKIMDDVFSQISFGVGRVNDTPIDHELFDDEAWGI